MSCLNLNLNLTWDCGRKENLQVLGILTCLYPRCVWCVRRLSFSVCADQWAAVTSWRCSPTAACAARFACGCQTPTGQEKTFFVTVVLRNREEQNGPWDTGASFRFFFESRDGWREDRKSPGKPGERKKEKERERERRHQKRRRHPPSWTSLQQMRLKTQEDPDGKRPDSPCRVEDISPASSAQSFQPQQSKAANAPTTVMQSPRIAEQLVKAAPEGNFKVYLESEDLGTWPDCSSNLTVPLASFCLSTNTGSLTSFRNSCCSSS